MTHHGPAPSDVNGGVADWEHCRCGDSWLAPTIPGCVWEIILVTSDNDNLHNLIQYNIFGTDDNKF